MIFNTSTAVTFLGVLGIAATSTLSMADSAYSASFVGEVSIAGSRVISTVLTPGVTSFNFSNIGGAPMPEGRFIVTDGTRIFADVNPAVNFTIGDIKDLPSAGQFAPVYNFLSFGDYTFDLLSISPSINTLNGSQALVSFAVTGTFTNQVNGNTYDGFGTFGAEITFPSNGINNFSEFQTFLGTPGRSITVQSWSANLQAVPEPFTMLGVGTAVGLGTFFKRKTAKKQDK